MKTEVIISSAYEAALLYGWLVLVLRLSGKRTLSKWNSFDFVVTIALGSTLASGILSGGSAVVQSATALATLVLLQLLITKVTVAFPSLEKLVKSEPALLVHEGKVLEDRLLAERVPKSEVMAALRQKGFSAPSEVDAVVLETDGSFSVIKSLSTEWKESTLSQVRKPDL